LLDGLKDTKSMYADLITASAGMDEVSNTRPALDMVFHFPVEVSEMTAA
jgi:hypothetical protein